MLLPGSIYSPFVPEVISGECIRLFSQCLCCSTISVTRTFFLCAGHRSVDAEQMVLGIGPLARCSVGGPAPLAP